MKKDYTLVLVFRYLEGQRQVLLGMKKRGFGSGKWNGFGGKVEPNESIEQAAIRELEEESFLTAQKLAYHGNLVFTFQSRPDIMNVHVFCTSEFKGDPNESDEMKPQWFNVPSLPYDQMWADDRIWLPHVLNGHKVDGRFNFDDESTILNHTLDVIPN